MEKGKKRRRYLVKPHFQLRWAALLASVGGLTAAIPASMLWVAIDRQESTLRETLRMEDALAQASDDVGVLLMNMPETTSEEAKALATQLERQREQRASTHALRLELLRRNDAIRAVVVGFVAGVIVLLFVWGIWVTHRIAGPLYVIQDQLERYAREGGIVERPLRRGDEFQEVYEALEAALRGGGGGVTPAENAGSTPAGAVEKA